MGDFTKLAKKVVSVARGEEKKKPSPYDTKATVNRIDYENRKAYVRFYGGVDETPVDLTINCSKGDTVQVRVGGGRAWIVGNQTAPPTDDKAVNILNHTVNNLRNQLDKTKEELEEEIEEIEPGEGKVIERIATEYILSTSNTEVIPYDDMEWSEELPEWVPSPRTYFWKRTVIYYTDGTVDEQDPILDANAQISAEADFAISSENNHFWHDSSGAWVTEVDQDDYISDPTQGGYANRVTNAGILQTYNGNLLTAWTGSGVSFYDGSGSTAATSKMLAAFYSSGITFDTTTPFTIGNTTGQNPSYIRWINTGTDISPNWKLQICADTIQFGGSDVVTTDEINLYSITTSVESIIQNESTTTPARITVYFYEAEEAFTGRLRVLSSTDGTNWSTYSSSYGASSYTVPLSSSGKKYYKIMMYEDDDSSYTNLLTYKTVPVVANGATGPQGPQGPAGEGALYNQYMDFNSNTEPKGLKIYAGNKSTYSSTFTLMQNDGLHIYKNNSQIAYFTSSGAMIGYPNYYNIEIDDSAIRLNEEPYEGGNSYLILTADGAEFDSAENGSWVGFSKYDYSTSKGCSLYTAYNYTNDWKTIRIGAKYTSGSTSQSAILDVSADKGGIVVNGHSSCIGAGVTGSNNSSLSLTSGTAKWISQIQLTAGNWIVIGECRFPSTTTSNKAGRLNIVSTSGSTNIDEQRVLGDIANHISLVKFVNPTSTTTYYLNAWQNTGSSVTVSSVSLYARRLA